ncbi:4-hydroxythreonine-4-phosphate dehydrogenase PdxA [Thermoflavimicrobium dichotomicum]|uniref:4-hydroxythreonine-4-phosphate dehydrogenase n=1 Tax=Thermoflavimicrobium dichotomicum TaxID=46223 RepID=A0A1I3V1T0_9BACL|nr:4-hydroxythreonine-4-phosphate dehydrogenase PdxA [Thermoflavimicrobium dichotomicum]SFJ88919.1 4-hydroxythreonine-4-phosphate dehydrogenase [Thermoflavimicrobium dichotomicum]
MSRPIIGITIGDPAGIGPEITLKALQKEEFYRISKPLVIGSYPVMKKVSEQLGISVQFNRIERVQDGTYEYGTIDVLDLNNVDVDRLEMGKVQKECGQASFEYIRKSAELALKGEIDAVCTAPINKEALKAANVPYIGHTEMFADLTKAEREMTMFSIENVKIFFLTRHVSLAEACRQINNKDFVLRGIRQAYQALEDLIGQKPRLAVAGLNPHSGEGGLLGREEIDAIRPAVEQACEEGMDVVGPVPADSVFHFARKGHYDAVLSLYHDQGHIAAKMIDFEKTVSITLGLPILRTSVDHGTAFDIAGKGIASPVSMIEAYKAAVQYAGRYPKKKTAVM